MLSDRTRSPDTTDAHAEHDAWYGVDCTTDTLGEPEGGAPSRSEWLVAAVIGIVAGLIAVALLKMGTHP